MVNPHDNSPNHGPLEKLINFSARNWLLTLMQGLAGAF